MLTIPVLAGRLVRLEPVTAGHASSLLDSVSSEEVWAWKPVPRPRTVADMRSVISDVMIGADGDRYPFAVVRLSDGAVIGSTSLYRVDLTQLRAEIGWTWLDRHCWGQGYNEDMKHALLRHCFDTLGLRRVEWNADSLNLRSRRALARLGFTYEGTLRSHRRRADGTRGDTVVYSLLAQEWPTAAGHLEQLIDVRSARPKDAHDPPLRRGA